MHSKSFLRLSRLLTISALSIVLMGCFDTGNGKDPVLGIPQIAVGKVVFSNVSGITYKTRIPEGVPDPESEYIEEVTGPDSEFTYYPGEMVTFTVGDIGTGILLGIVRGARRITAVEFTGSNEATDPAAVRMLRFVMSIDFDQIYANGITIENPSRANGLTLDFYESDDLVFEDQLANAVDILTEGANPVISEDAALDNFCYSYLFNGGQDVLGFSFEGCALGPDEELLLNGSFEAPEGGGSCSNNWTCFNDALTIPTGNQAPPAFDGNQMLKIFGPFFAEGGAGAYQEFIPVPGSEYTVSVQAQNSDLDNLSQENVAILLLVFSNDGNFEDDKGETSHEVIASAVFGTDQTYLEPNIWTELKITEKAPLDAVAARIVLFHIQIPGDAGGSIYYDQASVIGPFLEAPSVEFQPVWSDEFNDPVLNEGVWNVEDGYGIWNFGGNQEWQLYTPDNIRIVYEDPNDATNGYLEITAKCIDPEADAAPLAAGGDVAPLAAGDNLLANASFETPDASGGDVAGAGAPWGSFNSNFTTSNTRNDDPPGTFYSPDAHSGSQLLKQFGTDAGSFQDVPALPGETWTASAWAQSWSGDANNNTGLMQLFFRDDAGNNLCAIPGNQFEPCAQQVFDTSQPNDTWVELTAMAIAPAGTTTARIQLILVPDSNTPAGGSIFWDDATLSKMADEPPTGDETLVNASFETPDASGGDVAGAGAPWGSFNSNFTTSNTRNDDPPGTFYSPDAHSGTQLLKQFGTDAGSFQDVPALPDQTWTASAWAQSWSGDANNNTGLMQLFFRDDAGNNLCAIPGNQFEPCAQQVFDTSQPNDTWVELTAMATAPAGTTTARIQLILVPDPNTPAGGSLFWDDASLTQAVVEPPDCVAGFQDGSVTSGRINTLGKKDDIRYGKIVGRIKPPVGKAAWPAFWLLGTNEPDIGWPLSGEIDITEISTVGDFNNRTTFSTLHWCNLPDAEEVPFSCGNAYRFEGGSLDTGSSLGDDFHEFEVIWDPGRMVFYVDGILVWSRTIDPETMEEFNNDFYLILNLAIGGTLGSGGEPPDPNGANWELPQRMLVDWVEVYQAVSP